MTVVIAIKYPHFCCHVVAEVDHELLNEQKCQLYVMRLKRKETWVST